jgi:L-asparaginase
VKVASVLILGTGGTIAGRAGSQNDHVGYVAGELGVADVLTSVGVGRAHGRAVHLKTRDVAQIDSKDIGPSVWATLVAEVSRAMGDKDIKAVVITHGTDTVEETAWLLAAVLAPGKPVVLTCAMRPATALAPDGPQNLADALAVALDKETIGVTVVAAGQVHAAADIQKVHPYRVDAFSSGEAGPLGVVEGGRVRWLRPGAQEANCTLDGLVQVFQSVELPTEPTAWPWVAWVNSHGGGDGALVNALCEVKGISPSKGLAGLVVAGTGNGTIHSDLLQALQRAQARGVVVWRTSRCALGQVVLGGGLPVWPPAVDLPPAKARLALCLHLLAGR